MSDKPPLLFALIQRMWHQQPSMRPTIEEVITELDSPELKKQLNIPGF